jgi:hypothetical protein
MSFLFSLLALASAPRSGFYWTVVRNGLVNLKQRKARVDLLPPLGILSPSERVDIIQLMGLPMSLYLDLKRRQQNKIKMRII